MLKEFKILSEDEITLLIDAPALITILIGGADGNLDEKEITWAAKIKSYRSTKENSILKDYYLKASINFVEKIEGFLKVLPEELNERNKAISERLRGINNVFRKIDNTFAIELYKSYRTYAEQIAKASGGFLGFSNISTEEKVFLELSMIKNPEI